MKFQDLDNDDRTIFEKLFNQFLKFGPFDVGVSDIGTGTLLPE